MEKINVVSIKLFKEGDLLVESNKIKSTGDAFSVLKKYLDHKDREYLVVLTLDTRNKITNINTVSIGTLNSSMAHPREIFKTAILSNAESIIIGHNHVSGDSFPSGEDIQMTRIIKKCGDILGIVLLDHLIIGDDNYTSLKEKGII